MGIQMLFTDSDGAKSAWPNIKFFWNHLCHFFVGKTIFGRHWQICGGVYVSHELNCVSFDAKFNGIIELVRENANIIGG